MFIWQEYPAFFHGAFQPPGYIERRALAVRHRLIEAAASESVEHHLPSPPTGAPFCLAVPAPGRVNYKLRSTTTVVLRLRQDDE